MRGVLAIDLGSKKTGFAGADPLRIAVRALDVCRHGERTEELLAHIRGLYEERDVGVFLLGYPVHMDGKPGARAQAVGHFKEELAKAFPEVRIVLWDERLTTKAAEELLREQGYNGKEIARRRDSWSALVLLRDRISSGEPERSPAE